MWTFKRHVVSQKDMHFFNWFYWSGWFDGLMKGRHLYKPLLIHLLFYRGRKKMSLHFRLGRLRTKIILSFKPLVWLNHVQSEEGQELTRKKKKRSVLISVFLFTALILVCSKHTVLTYEKRVLMFCSAHSNFSTHSGSQISSAWASLGSPYEPAGAASAGPPRFVTESPRSAKTEDETDTSSWDHIRVRTKTNNLYILQ